MQVAQFSFQTPTCPQPSHLTPLMARRDRTRERSDAVSVPSPRVSAAANAGVHGLEARICAYSEPLLRLEVLLLPPPPSRLPSLLPPPTGAVAVATGLPPPAKEWLSSAPRPTVSGDMSPVEAEEATEAASIWKRRVLRGRFEGARGSPYPRRSSTRSPSLLAGNDCSTSALALLVRSPLQPSPQRR